MKIDLAKRREVMERSMALGHCICDPRRGCPCDVFRDQGICPCAGERPDPMDPAQIKLTRLVRNAGCASKISPADLEGVLRRLPEVKDPAVISGLAAADDAAIYRISDSLCLVQTVDVFTPCVDDPHLFGRICAANCLSDIYAMGGVPRTALSILAFPSETLDGEIMCRMLTGAMETLAEAGVALVGGHSIKDEEIKLGFAVTGLIDPAAAAALERARTGDVLVLTKPLGTGVLAFAEQIGRGHAKGLTAAAQSMATLNRDASEAMKEAGASACTDVTGFGLFGHLLRLGRQSGVTARIFTEALPAFPGALEALRQGIIPGAIDRNREFLAGDLEVPPGIDPALIQLGCDAQTSGGLLIAVPQARLDDLRARLECRRVTNFVIGEIVGKSAGRIVLSKASTSTTTLSKPETTMESKQPHHEARGPGCCADVFEAKGQAGTAAAAQQGFGAMLRAVQSAGALDARTKELILLSLVIYSRCAPCLDAHYRQARELGITDPEIEEAAWCAIAMGGAPVRMFFQEHWKRLRGDGGAKR